MLHYVYIMYCRILYNIGGLFFWGIMFSVCGIFFDLYMYVSLLFCFSAPRVVCFCFSLLLCFYSSLMFFASLLLQFSPLLLHFSASPLCCLSASPLFRVFPDFPASVFLCFLLFPASLLTCFSASLLCLSLFLLLILQIILERHHINKP